MRLFPSTVNGDVTRFVVVVCINAITIHLFNTRSGALRALKFMSSLVLST